MKEFKGTPAPWRIGKIKSCVVADKNDSLNIRGSFENESKDYYGGFLIAESVAYYNAKLISVSPELLELAFKYKSDLLNLIKQSPARDNRIAQIDDIINKALS